MADGNRVLFRAEGISRSYPLPESFTDEVRRVRAVDRVSFSLHEGEILGIAGPSGCGKSTLLRLCGMLERADSGALYLEERRIDELPPPRLRRMFAARQMVFQNPYAALNPRRRVGFSLAEPLIQLTRDDAIRRRQRTEAILEDYGIDPGASRRMPRIFSGGQRQRMALARAMISGPGMLFADEPLSSLDVSIQARFISLFHRVARESGVAVILVSHDLAVLRVLADRIILMDQGRIIENRNAGDFFDGPDSRLGRDFLESSRGRVQWGDR